MPSPSEVAELPEILAESEFGASRGRRPPSHLVRSRPRHVWSFLTERLMSRARIEYLGFDDPSVLASVGMPDDMMALGVSGMDGMLGAGPLRVHLAGRDGHRRLP